MSGYLCVRRLIRVSLCPSTCVPFCVCLFTRVCRFACLFACPRVCVCMYVSECVRVCMSVCPSVVCISICDCLTVYPSVCLSVCLYFCPSSRLSVCALTLSALQTRLLFRMSISVVLTHPGCKANQPHRMYYVAQ